MNRRKLAASKVKRIRRVKLHITVDVDACTGCGRCVEVCPSGSWRLKDGRAVWEGLNLCLECGACFHVCPVEAVRWQYPEGGRGVVYRF